MMKQFLICLLALSWLGGVASAQTSSLERDRLIREREEEQLRERANKSEAGIVIEQTYIEPQDEEFCFQINDINIEGIESLSAEVVQTSVDPYLNSCMGQTAVDSILQVLTQAYLDAGLITSRAYLPEQDLATGVLVIVVVEGTIEDVSFAKIEDGQAVPGKQRRFNFAFPTRPGKLLNLRDIEQGVDQINRVPSTRAQLDIAPGQTIGGSVLNIAYAEEDTTRLRFTIGQSTLEQGVEQYASFLFETDNILGVNDTWFLGLSGSETSNTLNTSISIPYGYFTGTFNASYSESVSQLTATTELFQPTTSFGLDLSYLAHRDGTSKTHVDFALGYTRSERFINGTALTPQSFNTYKLGVRHEHYGDGTFLSLRGGLQYGKLVSDATGIIPGSGPQTDFVALDLGGAFQKQFEGNRSLYLTLNGQLSGAPLFSSQQFSIGGRSNLRGINGASVSGDGGLSFTSEYSFPFAAPLAEPQETPRFADMVRPFVFLDAGLVWDKQTGTDSYGIGIGAGAKYYFKNNVIDVYAGIPLKSGGSLRSRGAEIGLNLSMKVF